MYLGNDKNLVIKKLGSPEEFHKAVEVQRSAWSMPNYKEAAPAHLLKALSDNGGLVLGAFIDNELVGVSYGWPVYARKYFYSHATGVLSGVKYRGVGFALKVKQAEIVSKEYGFDLIKWTFDPLQGLNSRFNLGKLGVIVRTYIENYYGEIDDNINRGIGSDRAKAEWYIASKRVLSRIEKKCVVDMEKLLAFNPIKVIEFGSNYKPIIKIDNFNKIENNIVFIEIPPRVSELRKISSELPILWRQATRLAYNGLIRLGFVMVDSIRIENRVVNILWRASLEEILESLEPWRVCSN